jgi:hypothetical protein
MEEKNNRGLPGWLKERWPLLLICLLLLAGVAAGLIAMNKKNAAESSAASVSAAQSEASAAASFAEKTAWMLTDEDVEQFAGLRPGLLLNEASEMVGPDYVNESDPTKSASLYNDHAYCDFRQDTYGAYRVCEYVLVGRIGAAPYGADLGEPVTKLLTALGAGEKLGKTRALYGTAGQPNSAVLSVYGGKSGGCLELRTDSYELDYWFDENNLIWKIRGRNQISDSGMPCRTDRDLSLESGAWIGMDSGKLRQVVPGAEEPVWKDQEPTMGELGSASDTAGGVSYRFSHAADGRNYLYSVFSDRKGTVMPLGVVIGEDSREALHRLGFKNLNLRAWSTGSEPGITQIYGMMWTQDSAYMEQNAIGNLSVHIVAETMEYQIDFDRNGQVWQAELRRSNFSPVEFWLNAGSSKLDREDMMFLNSLTLSPQKNGIGRVMLYQTVQHDPELRLYYYKNGKIYLAKDSFPELEYARTDQLVSLEDTGGGTVGIAVNGDAGIRTAVVTMPGDAAPVG